MDITTSVRYKDGFYDSMYYRCYFGVLSDEGGIPDNRIPTYLLTHWKPVYLTPYVTILKYYEGVSINGSVLIEGNPYLGSVVYVLDEYGIPHNYDQVDSNGNFNLIVPAGNISLHLYASGNSVMDSINIGEFSEAEATWKETIDRDPIAIEVEKASVNVTLINISKDIDLYIRSTLYPDLQFKQDVDKESYTFVNLYPDVYEFILANETGAILQSDSKFLKPGYNDIAIGADYL